MAYVKVIIIKNRNDGENKMSKGLFEKLEELYNQNLNAVSEDADRWKFLQDELNKQFPSDVTNLLSEYIRQPIMTDLMNAHASVPQLADKIKKSNIELMNDGFTGLSPLHIMLFGCDSRQNTSNLDIDEKKAEFSDQAESAHHCYNFDRYRSFKNTMGDSNFLNAFKKLLATNSSVIPHYQFPEQFDESDKDFSVNIDDVLKTSVLDQFSLPVMAYVAFRSYSQSLDSLNGRRPRTQDEIKAFYKIAVHIIVMLVRTANKPALELLLNACSITDKYYMLFDPDYGNDDQERKISPFDFAIYYYDEDLLNWKKPRVLIWAQENPHNNEIMKKRYEIIECLLNHGLRQIFVRSSLPFVSLMHWESKLTPECWTTRSRADKMKELFDSKIQEMNEIFWGAIANQEFQIVVECLKELNARHVFSDFVKDTDTALYFASGYSTLEIVQAIFEKCELFLKDPSEHYRINHALDCAKENSDERVQIYLEGQLTKLQGEALIEKALSSQPESKVEEPRTFSKKENPQQAEEPRTFAKKENPQQAEGPRIFAKKENSQQAEGPRTFAKKENPQQAEEPRTFVKKENPQYKESPQIEGKYSAENGSANPQMQTTPPRPIIYSTADSTRSGSNHKKSKKKKKKSKSCNLVGANITVVRKLF